jgi:hypothetical protein
MQREPALGSASLLLVIVWGNLSSSSAKVQDGSLVIDRKAAQ